MSVAADETREALFLYAFPTHTTPRRNKPPPQKIPISPILPLPPISPGVSEFRMARLSRLEQVFTESPVYFITACTQNRRHLLANEQSHDQFVRFCSLARARGVLVGKYVLMPDHFHLFVCIPPGAVGLSLWMKSLKNTLSKSWREQGIAAPHWQKGFFDHLIRSTESHAEKWRYVRENPVRAGYVDQAEHWPYAGEIQPDSWS